MIGSRGILAVVIAVIIIDSAIWITDIDTMLLIFQAVVPDNGDSATTAANTIQSVQATMIGFYEVIVGGTVKVDAARAIASADIPIGNALNSSGKLNAITPITIALVAFQIAVFRSPYDNPIGCATKAEIIRQVRVIHLQCLYALSASTKN